MFSRQGNPYDPVIEKATDEHIEFENWDIFLTVWDEVNQEGEAGARQCVQALQRRLLHRNERVQMFTLSLADSLVNNCGEPLHREMGSRSFTEALHRLYEDRQTSQAVRERIEDIAYEWVTQHKKDMSFDFFAENFQDVLAHRAQRAPRNQKSAQEIEHEKALRQREEDELQRALALSVFESKQRLWESENAVRAASVQPSQSPPSQQTSASEIPLDDERAIFDKAPIVDRLVSRLQEAQTSGQNVSDDPELVQLYEECMSLRPAVSHLLDQYTQKQNNLTAMNTQFNRAFDVYQNLSTSDPTLASSADLSRSNTAVNSTFGDLQRSGTRTSEALSVPSNSDLSRVNTGASWNRTLTPQDSVGMESYEQGAPEESYVPFDPRPYGPNPPPNWTLEQWQEYQRQWAEYERATNEYWAAQNAAGPASSSQGYDNASARRAATALSGAPSEASLASTSAYYNDPDSFRYSSTSSLGVAPEASERRAPFGQSQQSIDPYAAYEDGADYLTMNGRRI